MLRQTWRMRGCLLPPSQVARDVAAEPACSHLALTRHVATHSQNFDAIVVGLGAHGSACLYHLARAGCKVLGIDRFDSVSNAYSSHHGQTRITRMAYMEGPKYIPLLHKCFELYKQLEDETGQKLYHQTGVLNIGNPVFSAAHAAAVHHSLPHEVLTGKEACKRLPGLALPDDTPVLSEEIGGILEPERMIQAHMHRGQQCGAQVQLGHPVIGWAAIGSKGGVAVTTDKDTYYAERLIISPGAWIDQLVPEFKGLCVPGRATVAWFKPPQPRLYHSSSFPVFILQDDHTDAAYYGFPEHGDAPGFKIGKFDAQYGCIPDTLDRNQHQSDIAPLAAVMQRYFPRAAGPVINFSACMFTATPDGQFIIDTHPRHPQVLLCSACSGHGFKLSPVVGYALAHMAQHCGTSPTELSDELQMHRLHPSRKGHDEVLTRFS